MSTNYKKTQNYSALLGEMKGSAINERVKGRNYKMYMKRVQSNLTDTKTEYKSGTASLNESTQKYSSIDKRVLDKKKILTIGTDYTPNKKSESLYDLRNKSEKSEKSSLVTPVNKNTNIGNKIDIKISVNYNKPCSTINYGSSNMSSSLSSTKSFNHQHNPSYLTTSQINQTADYLLSHSQNNRDKNFVNINNKYVVNKNEDEMKKTASSSSIQLSHKRNQSENYYNPNSLNISLIGYDNKSSLQKDLKTNSNYISSDKQHNHSFAYNSKLYNHMTESTKNPVRNDEVIQNLDNIHITEDNMKDFTLKKNNDDLLDAINHYNSNTINKTNPSKVLILETNLQDHLRAIKEEKTDKIQGMNKKLQIYKKISEEYLNSVNNSPEADFIKKIFDGLQEIAQTAIGSCSKLNEKMSEFETLSSNYKIVTKKYTDLYKAYQERSEEVKLIKSRKSENPQHISPKIEENTSGEGENNNNRSRMMTMINKNVVDDLDGIYFFDKIDARANSASHKKIPKLDLNFLESKYRKQAEEERHEKEHLKMKKQHENNKNHKVPILGVSLNQVGIKNTYSNIKTNSTLKKNIHGTDLKLISKQFLK